jgi:hypothetical protein
MPELTNSVPIMRLQLQAFICLSLVSGHLSAFGVDKHAISVRVLNPTGVEGIAGAVLLVNPGRSDQSIAAITDKGGNASIPTLDCEICTMTVADPTGLFGPSTTEFNGRSSSITLTLPLKPIIDVVRKPGSISCKLLVLGPGGAPLAKQQVVIRPNQLTLEVNWVSRAVTDMSGFVTADLVPGEYTLATLLGNEAFQHRFDVPKGKSQQIRIDLDQSESKSVLH